jgi:hypothetical protein
MSSITKTAVYDARLLQDPPAYAVQKGALSVSVAPFNAIAATASSMVFQVMVPSLNVFVDRKIQLRTTLNFSANLFYSGPRGVTSYVYTVLTGDLTGTGYKLTVSGGFPATIRSGSYISFSGQGVIPAFKTNVVFRETDNIVVVDTPVRCAITAMTAGSSAILAQPSCYDSPDPATGVRFDLSSEQYTVGNPNTGAFQRLGYATAVSAKDLSFCMFPVQSCISSMTATLNDCTVTTNGDTLHEQIMLTNTKENVKQRTTPCNTDVYAWGWDDANNGSGNFSSYSVVNSLGDLPTGAFPTTWYADKAGSKPLTGIKNIQELAAQAGITPTVTAGAPYPFLPEGTTGAFYQGTGWYIAKFVTSQVVGANALYGGLVVVPFVDGQPVWATSFPGGDLLGLGNNGGTAGDQNQPGFTVTNSAASGSIPAGEYLTLLKDVPPFSIIGARIYKTAAANTAGTQIVPVGFVSGVLTGAMGSIGSTYSFVTSEAGGLNAIEAQLGLQAGFPVATNSMPVFGAVSVVEPLVISPLIWADAAEFQSVGLYGMTNMQFVLNFTGKLGTALAVKTGFSFSSLTASGEALWCDDLKQVSTNTGNIIRSSGIRTTISDLEFLNLGSTSITGPWLNPTLLVTFLTPGPDVTLPLVSTVPYVEMPRYVLQQTVSTGQIGNGQLATNTISLTSIPDMIMLYVKPATKGPSQLDVYMPIKNVSVSFDNFSNLLSGFQQVHLYEATVAAGMDIDFNQFRGFAQAATPSWARKTGQTAFASDGTLDYTPAGVTQLSGSPLLLRMGHDITLSPGLAPGCLGNYSIQVNMTVDNQFGFFDYVNTCTITLIAINTGFFETVRGQSAIRKTVLNSADVEAAIPEAGVSRTQLTRMVGRGSDAPGYSTLPGKALSMARAYMKDGAGGYGSGVGRAMDMGMDVARKVAKPSSGLRN